MTSKLTLALALACAFLAGALGRDLLVSAAHADTDGFTAQDARSLLRALEKNADATKSVAEAVRNLKR